MQVVPSNIIDVKRLSISYNITHKTPIICLIHLGINYRFSAKKGNKNYIPQVHRPSHTSPSLPIIFPSQECMRVPQRTKTWMEFHRFYNVSLHFFHLHVAAIFRIKCGCWLSLQIQWAQGRLEVLQTKRLLWFESMPVDSAQVVQLFCSLGL